ncbi:ATP-dependent DNA helicase RecQ-like [Dreissena polymorpha]|uniref:ATP-dependent DNA helicase RecQ-like n=1 Tax=Dreissena polymorpha TaxID=45954 RepID=UPI002263D132|nr:ATP-dependent DNA helicase RecQ-like [Dreissena polymorpha]
MDFRRACEYFKIENLNDFQSKSISNLLNGRDVFLSTRTGGGKSLVYQIYQFIKREQCTGCQVVVVTPLLSIMKEQCEYLTSLGFKATFIGRDPNEESDILSGMHDFIYSSPESLLGVQKWRDMMANSTSIKLIVVDEAHTIIQWGEADSEQEKEPFREWFGKLGEVRSLVECPILLITATANKAARTKVKQLFCLQKCFEIVDSPDRLNIKLFCHRYTGSLPLSLVFKYLVTSIKDKKEKSERYLIFCTSIKNCTDVYTMLRMELDKDINYVHMYHSQTAENVKEVIKKDMGHDDGLIRLLVATSAAGMGVNFKGVNQVINYGVPKNMDTFVQQLGRAGRDGTQAMALLLYCGRQCKGIDSDMKNYISDDSKCRRNLLLSAYNTDVNKGLLKHLCCDICEQQCDCGSPDCKLYAHPVVQALTEDISDVETSSSSSESSNSFSDFS